MQKDIPGSGLDGRPQYPIESVDNALRVLQMFRDHKQLRLADITESLGVAHSTAHRLMAMLLYRGFVQRDGASKIFSAGPTLLEVGLTVVRSLDIRTAARPILQRLREELGETIHLAALEGHDVRFLDAVESEKALRVTARTGRLLPAHCTSVGKALLAELSTAQLRLMFPKGKLTGMTEHSITSRRELERELETARMQGFATNREEFEAGVGSVGVVVRDGTNTAVAALSVSAPVSRLSDSMQTQAVHVLTAASADLGALL